MANQSLSAFDYSILDSTTRIAIQQTTTEIKTLVHKTTRDILDIGARLIDVKAKLGHGNFTQWLDTEFGWSPKTAQNIMNVARTFHSNEIVGLKFDTSALYLLAAPSTSENAREEAISRAKTGEVITRTSAKTIINGHQSDVVSISGRSVYPREVEQKIRAVATRIRNMHQNTQSDNCFVCGKHQAIAEQHHLIPVRTAAEIAVIEHKAPVIKLVWLCPNHHRFIHLLERLRHLPFSHEYQHVWLNCLSNNERQAYFQLFEIIDFESESHVQH